METEVGKGGHPASVIQLTSGRAKIRDQPTKPLILISVLWPLELLGLKIHPIIISVKSTNF